VGVTRVTFLAHLLECEHKGHQSFLPRDDDALSTVQLLLSSNELLLQLNDLRM
jgi:hypothetical protein